MYCSFRFKPAALASSNNLGCPSIWMARSQYVFFMANSEVISEYLSYPNTSARMSVIMATVSLSFTSLSRARVTIGLKRLIPSMRRVFTFAGIVAIAQPLFSYTISAILWVIFLKTIPELLFQQNVSIINADFVKITDYKKLFTPAPDTPGSSPVPRRRSPLRRW